MDTEDLKKALDALHYEIWMFNRTVRAIALVLERQNQLKIFSECKQVECNVYLESFLLHSRNIIDFFQQKKSEKKYIKFVDFGYSIPKIINLPKDNQLGEINKYLSHITWSRIGSVKPKWQIDKIKEEINRKIEEFINSLDDACYFPTPDNRTKKVLNR